MVERLEEAADESEGTSLGEELPSGDELAAELERSYAARRVNLRVTSAIDVADFDTQPKSEGVPIKEQRAIALARMATGDLVKRVGMVGLLQVREFVHQHSVDDPLGHWRSRLDTRIPWCRVNTTPSVRIDS